MGNFLTDFANNAKKKAVQFEQSFNSAPRPAAPAPAPAAPQFSPLAQQRIMARNPSGGAAQIAHGPVMPTVTPIQHFNPIQQIVPTIVHQAVPNLKAAGLGLARVGSGIVQDTSGLADLVGKGNGTSRVTKAATSWGKSLDKEANQLPSVVRPTYHIAQGVGTAAAFLAPGGGAEKLAVNAPKAATKAGLITRTAANLAEHGAPGRIAATALKDGTSKANLINAAVGTAQDIGHQTSMGQKITPQRVGLDVGTNLAMGAGLPAATQALKEAVPGLKAGGKAIASRVGQAKNTVALNDGITSQNRQLANEIASHQKQQAALPIGTDAGQRAHEVLQRKIDTKTAQIAQNEARRPQQNILQKATDKVLTAQPGMSMKAVTTDATPAEVLPHEAVPQPVPASRGTGGVSSGNGTTKPTGIVDKHLQELQDAHKEIVNAEAAHIASQQPAKSDLYNKVVQHGGISSSAYESLPNYVKRSGGLSADKMAQELGYPSEDHLIQDLQAHTDINNSRLTPTQIREQAVTNLESGKSQYNAEYKDIKDRLAQRQDELSLYPKGTRSQVKVASKPQKMSDAELQSLAKTPEGIQPKKGNDFIQRNDKKVIRNADAERQVQEVLKKGGSTDEALQSYMAATGVDLQTAVKDVRRVAADSGLGFTGGKNPLIGTIKIPKVQAGDAHQPLLNADYVAQHEQAIGGDALKAFNSLSEHDKTLLKDIETRTVDDTATRAENPQAFKDAEKAIRMYYDTRHAYDQHLGIDVGYRQNYLRQLFTKAEDQAGQTDQMNIKGGNKRPGYTQTRTKDTLNTHVGDALQRDINGASANHAKLTYAKGLNEAFPGKTNTSGQLVRDDTGNYMQLTNRYGQGVTAQKDIAQQINRRSWQPTDNKALAAYDKANAGIKFIKLGGGAFHALTEAGNFIGQQLSSGKLFTNPSASGKVLKTFFSPKTMDKELATFRKNGTIDNAALAGLKHGYKEILADASVSVENKLSKYTGIKALHDATFKREIPYAKLKMFEQGTKGLDAHNPADLAIMRTKAREINQIFGGINRDVQGITPAAFKRMQRFVLATDFTESKIHTASDALTDWKSPAGKLARQTVVGKALLFAAVAAGAGALGGEYKNKSPQEVAKNILGKFADPSFSVGKYKVGLPATHVSEFTKPLSPLFRKDGGDKFSGLQRYGTNRLAAVPSEVLQLRTNKDASGSRIYGKDYKANGGKPISAGKTALNIAGGFVPIPVAQGIGVGTGKTNIPSAIANTIGLRVSDPSQFTKTATSGNTPVDKLKATEKQQNKDLKASLSPEDYKLSQLSKDDRAKLIKDGSYTADKFKGLDNYVNSQKQKLGMKVPADKTNNGISAHSQKVLDEYNKLSSDQIKQKAYKENDYDYKVIQAKYENDKANNKLSKSQLISRADTVRKAQVGSGFSKDTRETYGTLSKSEVYNLITTDPNGKQIASDLLAYGDALQKNGIENNKYRTLKTGAEAFKPKTAVGQTSTASSRHASQMALLKAFKTPYSDLVKSQSKGAQLARSAKLGKKRA